MTLVGKQRGDTRRHWPTIAAAALVGLTLAGPAPQPTASPTAEQGARQAVTRQALPPEKGGVRRVRRRDPRTGGGRGKDQRRSLKRLRRRILTALFGIPESGRQWVRLRKELRRLAPALLSCPLHQLTRLPSLRIVRRAA